MAMTAQEIFTKVATHLLTQKQRARDVHPNGAESPCRYRTAAGLSCAVGCLIPEDLYDPRIEGTILNGVIDRARDGELPPALASFVLAELEPHHTMLWNLQHIHDQWNPETEWHECLAGEAHRLGLEMPAP